jgi:hypothetical protein
MHGTKLALVVLLLWCHLAGAQVLDLKKEYATTLLQLTETLLQRQVNDEQSPTCGAIACKACTVWHTRAAEAVYPFAVAYGITGEARYLNGAIDAAKWLIRQQEVNGSWKETPEEWTGTTTDQLLMMMLAYELIHTHLTTTETQSWKESIRKAADYLYTVMKPEFASINYVATTTATLAKAYAFSQNKQHLEKARELAHRTISKMDEYGFINGEGGRGIGNKLGIDLGYEMEMSLWGLGLYARLTQDSLVDNYVRKSLKEHLYFIYPDGSLDNSWGIRSNKWTLYGGATSDGCQALFALYDDDDERYATASWRNLQFIRKSILPEGLIGYGPHHYRALTVPPCIYPTFTKAKNLAMAYQLDKKGKHRLGKLPADSTGWMKYFPSLDLVQVRTKQFMATITGYRYKDQAAGARSKYMHRPNGGTQSYLWLKDFGALQVSSVTAYSRPEPMSFPEAPGVQCLTPQIAYRDSTGYFTNLYEFDSQLRTQVLKGPVFKVIATGELKNKDWINGGVAYQLTYDFGDDYIDKTIRLTYHDAFPVVTITEPFVEAAGSVFTQLDSTHIRMRAQGKAIHLDIQRGKARLFMGRNEGNYRMPYPAVKAYPIELEIAPPVNGFTQEIRYRVWVEKWEKSERR